MRRALKRRNMRMSRASEGGAAKAGLAGLLEAHRAELLRFLTARCGDRRRGRGPVAGVVAQGSANCALGRSPTAGPTCSGWPTTSCSTARASRQRAMRRDRGWLEREAPVATAVEDRPDPSPDAEAGLLEAGRGAGSCAKRSRLPARRRAAGLAALSLRRAWPGRRSPQIMGISRSGVEKHLAVAMKHLRKHLRRLRIFRSAPSDKQERPGGPEPDGKTMHDRG